MKAALFAGGETGRHVALHLARECRENLSCLVWDTSSGVAAPDIGVPTVSREDAPPLADTLLSAAYGEILSDQYLARFRLGAFNAHPSLLPAYRGRHAIQWAIANGETVFGVTIHKMMGKIDAGDALLVRSIDCSVEDDLVAISRKLATLAADMLVELVADLAQNRPLKAVALADSTYLPRRRPEDGRIDWTKPGRNILNLVRSGTADYPAFATTSDGQPVSFTGYLASSTPGEVLYASSDGCLIATADGQTLWLKPSRPLSKGEKLG